ncbi:MAG TPA: hypothetical protein VGC37_04625 [Friedmanniella sp.]
MAIFGTICFWSLTCIGAIVVVGLVIGGVQGFLEGAKEESVEPPRPPAQITNLRTIPEPAPKVDPNQPQVLQKTTMEITTTKYVDPNAKPPKEISA